MILDNLKSKLPEYQKAKDLKRLSALRYFLSKIQNKEIELRPKGEEVTDEVAFRLLRKLIKQRDEAIEQFEQLNRTEDADREREELEIIKEFADMFPWEVDKLGERGALLPKE